MGKIIKKISILLSTVMLLQFFHPISGNTGAVAVKAGGEIRNAVIGNNVQIKLDAFAGQSIKSVKSGRYAFVTAGIPGLTVLDMRNPDNQSQVAYLAFPEKVSLIGIYGSRIYLPSNNYLYIVDIADPLHPACILKAPIHPEGAVRASDMELRDGAVYVKGVRSVVCADKDSSYAVNDFGGMSRIDSNEYPLSTGGTPENKKSAKDKNQKSAKDKNQKTAYITIDDGPSKNITPMNLDTLKKYGVKATFFVLPRSNVDSIYKRIVDEGHVIGNHSYSHDYGYLYGSTENFKKDVLKARDFINKKLGYTSTVFRFPGGSMSRSKSVIKERADILADLGYKYFDWNVSTADTDPNLKKYGNEETIVNLLANNVIKGAKGRKKLIILMHDSQDKKYSAKALPKIIEGLQKQGYIFDVLTNY